MTTMSSEEASERDRLLAHGPIVGRFELPRAVIAASPELRDEVHRVTCEAGMFEVIEEPDGEGIVVRRPGANVARWAFLATSEDDDYVISAARDDFAEIEYPERVTRAVAMESGVVWITHPGGDPLRVFVGHAASGDVVAFYVQLSWAAA